MSRRTFITSAVVRVPGSAMRCTYVFSARKPCVATAWVKKRLRSSHAAIVWTTWIHATLQTKIIVACAICSAQSAFRCWPFHSWTCARKWCTTSTASFASGTPTNSTIRPKTSTIFLLKFSSIKDCTSNHRKWSHIVVLFKFSNSTSSRLSRSPRTKCESSATEKKVSSFAKTPRRKSSIAKKTLRFSSKISASNERWTNTCRVLTSSTTEWQRHRLWLKSPSQPFLIMINRRHVSTNLTSRPLLKVPWALTYKHRRET